MNRGKLVLNAFIYFTCILSFHADSNAQGLIADRNLLYNKSPTIGSPNAAALEKFVEFPTANYTGVPDISVPIYQITTKSLKIPIGISYHAGGIKVDEVASDVGSGWALIAGGCINILANGLRDEHSGFPNDTAIFNKIKALSFQQSYNGGYIDCTSALMYADGYFGPDPYGLYAGGDIGFLTAVVEETEDSEPDVYTFNFLGRTGKFFKDEMGVFRTMSYSELKIQNLTQSGQPAGYRITDENGIIYEFKTEGGTTEHIQSPSDIYHQVTRPSTSYYLTKIISPEGEIIDFYSSAHLISYYNQTTFSRAKTFTQSACWQMNSYGDLFYYEYTSDSLTVDGMRIDSIKASTGTLVKFLYHGSDRTDLSGARSLDTIQVWDYLFEKKKIKEILLGHDYSTNRLTLTSIQLDGQPPTKFTYYSSLPDRLSYSQDHYGYYNQRSNLKFLPQDEYMEFWDGADRSIDSNYTQAGILSKITHPTGGSTKFIYEANQYFVPDTITTYPKVSGPSMASYPNTTVADTFNIPSSARRIRIYYEDSFDGTNFANDYCIIHLTGPNSYSHDFVGDSMRNAPPLDLEAGQYILSIENVGSTYSASAYIFWFEETHVAPHNEIGGGVRIKQIEKCDSTGNPIMTKKFEYKITGTNHSSGAATFAPVYIDYKDQIINKQGDGTHTSTCISTNCSLVVQCSNSIAPMADAYGNFVNYSEVTTYIKDSTQNGYTNYKYNIGAGGFNTGIPSFPYAPRIIYDWTNGVLLEQRDYGYVNNQYKLLKKTKATYNYDGFNPDTDTIKLYKTYGAKIATQDPPFVCWSVCDGTPIGTYFSDVSFGIQQYKLYSSWHRLEKTEDTIYSMDGSNPLANVTNYYYDDTSHIQLTRTQSLNSKGDTIKKELKYPYHFLGTAVYDSMLARNMISPTVQETVYKNSTQLSRVKTNYALWQSNAYILPSTVQASKLSNSLETEATYNYFNNKANLLQVTGKDGLPHSYIWDYANNIPIAECSNTDTTSIAFTSFEGDGKGNWSFSSAAVSDYSAPTGKKAYLLNGSNDITKSGLSSGTTYIISYWTKNGSAFSVTGTISGYPISGRTISGWKYFEHHITGQTTITISGNGSIDELRLYPANARMITYCYKPLIGMISQCDPNNKITYYEYDGFNRLVLIRDQDKNVLKTICYNYAGQTENCGFYGNSQRIQIFTRNNCGGDSIGSQVPDTIKAGTYSATTQAEADSLAQADLNTNGQAYANAHGTCSPLTIYARVELEDAYSDYITYYATVWIRFYSDAGGTIPLSVTNLTVNYDKIKTFCNSAVTPQSFSPTCNGTGYSLGNQIIEKDGTGTQCYVIEFDLTSGGYTILY